MGHTCLAVGNIVIGVAKKCLIGAIAGIGHWSCDRCIVDLVCISPLALKGRSG